MSAKETLSICQICGGRDLRQHIASKDFMVSGESFSVSVCTTCSFCFTNPRPQEETSGIYYEHAKYLSHTNKKNSLLEYLYAAAKFFTLRWKSKLIHKHFKQTAGLNILDVGCGTGDFIKFCSSQGTYVTGVEPSDKARTSLSKTSNLNIHKNLDQISPSLKYDLITFWHVLEHIYDMDGTLSKVKSLLKDGGLIFVALPNRKSYDAIKYEEYWAAWDVPRHLWHFDRTNVKSVIEKHGMNILEIIPMKLDAYYVSMLSERYKNNSWGLGALLKGLINGFKSNLKAKKNNEYSSLLYIISK